MNSIILIASYIIAAFHLYLKPDRIPAHWDINGNIDKYLPFPWGILIYPFIMTIMYLLLKYMNKFDPFMKKNSKKWQPIVSILLILFLGIQIFILIDYYYTPSINLFPIIFGIFLIVFGNYLPIIPQNGFIGIRTPWTLASVSVWKKTHKYSGYLAIISGFLSIILGFFKLDKIAFYVIIFWAIVSLIMSYFIWKNEKKNS